MGFMEDIGRSNAMSGVNNVMGKAIELRQNEDKSAERAYTLGMESEKLGMAKEDHELDTNKKRMELLKAQEEEAFQSAKSDVSTNPAIQKLPENVRKDALKWGQEQGFWDENNIGSRRNFDRAYNQLKENKEVFNRFMWPTTQAHKANLLAAQEELAEMESKDTPNPEKIQQMKQRIGSLQKVYDTSIDGYSKAQEAFDKKEQDDQKRKELKNAKVAADPNSSTGFSYFGSDGAVLLRGAPKPASDVRERLGDANLKERTRRNKALEALKAANKSGSKSTSFIQNVDYMVEFLGMDRAEAAKLFSESKPMSRETYIATVSAKLATDPYVDSEDAYREKLRIAIEVYDSANTKPDAKGAGKQLDAATAKGILAEAGGDKGKARELAKQRGYKF